MKFRYLGTAAAEGFPAMFCRCDACEEARRLGGINLRTRSQALIGEDLLLDFPPDTYAHAMRYGLRLDAVKYLFVTHAHCDHFSPDDLTMRGAPYSHRMRQARLNVYGNDGVEELFERARADMPAEMAESYTFVRLRAYTPVQAGAYTVIPLPARHSGGREPFIFAIRGEGKNILYAHDTGMIFGEVFDFLAKEKLRFDLVSLDCTMVANPVSDEGCHMGVDGCVRVLARLTENGNADGDTLCYANPVSDEGCHMGVDGCVRVLARLTENGNADGDTLCYANHFSHNGAPLQENLERLLSPHGIRVAYDGLGIEL